MALIPKFVLKVAFLFALLGLFVSRPTLLQWLATQDPVTAFFLWYLVLFAFIFFGSIWLFGAPTPDFFRINIGLLVFAFAVGIVYYFPASNYALGAVGANPSGVPSFLLASEDQLTYEFWRALGVPNEWLMGILIYALTTAALIVVAGIIIGKRGFTTMARGFLRPV